MNTVERYIQTEKLALKTYVPIDRYVKDRPQIKETHKVYFKENFIMIIRENLIQTTKSSYVQICMMMKLINRTTIGHYLMTQRTLNYHTKKPKRCIQPFVKLYKIDSSKIKIFVTYRRIWKQSKPSKKHLLK